MRTNIAIPSHVEMLVGPSVDHPAHTVYDPSRATFPVLPPILLRPILDFRSLVSASIWQPATTEGQGNGNTTVPLSIAAKAMLTALGCDVGPSPSVTSLSQTSSISHLCSVLRVSGRDMIRSESTVAGSFFFFFYASQLCFLTTWAAAHVQITLAPSAPLDMNALKRRIFEIPVDATSVCWCYGLTELSETVDDALTIHLEEAVDAGESATDTSALSLLHDGGFVYSRDDG
jgi:hypothetical protein